MQLSKEGEYVMSLAKTAYEGYCAKTGNKSVVTGDELPKWEALPGGVCNAWFSAMSAVHNRLKSDGKIS